mmetsp:Transcript_56356/g.122688  ORF Transcript_56356/g.122688 Transcript_56356/m.122688 type:complete len:296 (+) Transcript_56356:1295-2182(+)
MRPSQKPPCTGSENCRKFIAHTARQMSAITRARSSPKASIFWPSGVFSSSSEAVCTLAWICPISVRIAVATTSPIAWPLDTVVPEKSMLRLSWMRDSRLTGSSVFITVSLSPVSGPSSKRTVVVFSLSRRKSAGTLSPTPIWTMSPGTSSLAGTVGSSSPFRTQQALHVCSCLSASSALSALASCQTPTIALITRISRITNGSTNACIPSSWWSSKKARTKERTAAPSRILTSRSSNCASTSFQSGVPSSLSSSFGPYFSLNLTTCSSVRPFLSSLWPKAERASAVVRLQAASIV